MRNCWTDEEIKTLRELRNSHTLKEIAQIIGRSFSAVKTKARKLGLLVTREVYTEHVRKNRTDLHPKEGVQWVRENQHHYNTVREMLPVYNEKFGKNINLNAFNRLLHDNGIKRGKVLWDRYNKARRGKHNPYRDRYKIGDEIVRSNGYVYIKVADNVLSGTVDKKTKTALWNSCWKLKQVKIYEDYYNVKVKKDEVVIFLDGNNKNFDISNLRCISRVIAGAINASGFSSKGHITEAGIEVMQTIQVLKELQNG